LDELSTAVAKGTLPKVHVRLYGRNQPRLERIQTYFKLRTGVTGVIVSTHQSLESALTDATHLLCQIRPGGMESRAKAERAALATKISGDEGLGPSGLAVFLLGRSAIQTVIDQCARSVNYPASLHSKVFDFIQSRTGLKKLTYSLAGLNHQSWLYDFRDTENIDRKNEVIAAIDDPELVNVDPNIIQRMKAIPMPYLKLFFHTNREFSK